MNSFDHLLPLPLLDINYPRPVRAADRAYFKFYGLDYPEYQHHFGRIYCQSLSGLNNNVAGWNIATHVYLPKFAQGSVFILHGLFDHVGIYNHLIDFALSHQLAVFTFDLPGHGLSSGERAAINDFKEYTHIFNQLIAQVQTVMPQPWHLVGQSTGATIIMNALQEGQAQFVSHALMAPLVRPHLWSVSRHLFAVLRLFVSQRPRHFAVNSSNLNFLRFVEHADVLQPQALRVDWVAAMQRNIVHFMQLPICEQPLLVIQGDRDTTVDWQFNLKQIKEKFAHTEVALLEGAGHQLLNEQLAYRQQWQQLLERLWFDQG